MVAGTLFVFDREAYVFFDSRSTHTFVSSKFVKTLFVKSEKLGFDLCVSTLVGSVLCACDVLKSCKVVLGGKTLFVDLIILDIYDFDVIFEMDWMSMHGVSIHYKEKKILFTLEGETVIFEGVKSRSLPRVISALQALRSVKNGCQAFLTSVVDTSKETHQSLI